MYVFTLNLNKKYNRKIVINIRMFSRKNKWESKIDGYRFKAIIKLLKSELW